MRVRAAAALMVVASSLPLAAQTASADIAPTPNAPIYVTSVDEFNKPVPGMSMGGDSCRRPEQGGDWTCENLADYGWTNLGESWWTDAISREIEMSGLNGGFGEPGQWASIQKFRFLEAQAPAGYAPIRGQIQMANPDGYGWQAVSDTTGGHITVKVVTDANGNARTYVTYHHTLLPVAVPVPKLPYVDNQVCGRNNDILDRVIGGATPAGVSPTAYTVTDTGWKHNLRRITYTRTDQHYWAEAVKGSRSFTREGFRFNVTTGPAHKRITFTMVDQNQKCHAS